MQRPMEFSGEPFQNGTPQPLPFGGSMVIFIIVLCAAFAWFSFVTARSVSGLLLGLLASTDIRIAFDWTIKDYLKLLLSVRILFNLMIGYALFLLFSKKRVFIIFFAVLFSLYCVWMVALNFVLAPLLLTGFWVPSAFLHSLSFWIYFGSSFFLLVAGGTYLNLSERAQATFVL